MAQLRLTEYQGRMARHYNARVRPRAFQVGHLVLKRVQKHVGALDPTWEGPFEVKGIVRPGTYILADLKGDVLAHPWNAEHLKRYYLEIQKDFQCICKDCSKRIMIGINVMI